MRVLKRSNLNVDISTIEALSERFSLPKKFIELLFYRGIDNEEKIEAFFKASPNGFNDPFILKGMKQAVERINTAIKNQETIVIFSDYDADGICSASILALYFKKIGTDVYVHIPDRVTEGYGLSIESLERIIENVNPDLIITCDCGISCANEVEYVLDLGVDIIVTDHHAPAQIVPECVVINPLLVDCPYPDKTLCGAGVVLKLVQALSSIEESLEFTDIAAIATVADLVSLTGESRLIVKHGLKVLAERKNLGLSRLIDYLKLDCPTSADIGYKIAPRINASGRMGDASRAFDLICSSDALTCDNLIKEIDADNDKRKAVCDKIYANANEKLLSERLYEKKCIILNDSEWEKGVIGIVAAKLTSDFKRPVIIMAGSDDNWKGTARSIEGINMHEVLTKHADLFVEFGGHSQAAGFTILGSKIDELKTRLGEYFESFDDELFTPRVYFDVELEESDINTKLLDAISLIEPCGHGNHTPLFRLSANSLRFSPCKTNINHTQITTSSGITIYAYNNLTRNQFLYGDGKKDLIIELQKPLNKNLFPVMGVARQIVSHELHINDDYARASFLKTLNFKPNDAYLSAIKYLPNKLEEIVKDKGIYGTLFVAGCKKTFDKALSLPINKHIIIKEFLKFDCKNNYNRLIVSPDFDAYLPLKLYNRIVFLDTPPMQLVSRLINKLSCEVYIPNEDNFKDFIKDIDLSRQTFGLYFSVLKKHKTRADNLIEYFEKTKENGMNLAQFVICLTVFIELGIVSVGKSGFSLEIDPTVRSPLNMSKTYNFLLEVQGK